MAHKDIRIKFEIENRHFEAVGFLADGEISVSGDEMLARTVGEDNWTNSEEVGTFLFEHVGALRKLPLELREYYLTTNQRDPGHPWRVRCFIWSGGNGFVWPFWDRYWHNLNDQWSRHALVVRRCT